MRLGRLLLLMGIAAAAGLAALPFAPSRAGEDGDGAALLDGPEVRELLAILESETFRDPAYCDLRSEALKQLERVVREGGDALRDAAIARIRARGGDERKVAELVLAQFEKLPDEAIRPLLADRDVEVATWAYLTLDRAEAADLEPWSDLTAADGLATIDLAPSERDPLLDVFPRIREKVAGFELSAARASRRSPDEEEPTELTLSRWRPAARDGELYVVLASEHEWQSPVFVAILERDKADAPWSLSELVTEEQCRHIRVGFEDVDGDGLPDVCLAYWSGGTPSWECLDAFSSRSKTLVGCGMSCHDDVQIVRRGADVTPLLLERAPYKANYGGTAVWTVGVAATRYDVSRWADAGPVHVGSVWIRNMGD